MVDQSTTIYLSSVGDKIHMGTVHMSEGAGLLVSFPSMTAEIGITGEEVCVCVTKLDSRMLILITSINLFHLKINNVLLRKPFANTALE